MSRCRRAPRKVSARGAINLDIHTVLTDAAEEVAQHPLLPMELAPYFPLLETIECRGRRGMGVVYAGTMSNVDPDPAANEKQPGRLAESPIPAASIGAAQPETKSLMNKILVSLLVLTAAGTFLVAEYRAEAKLRKDIQFLNAQAIEADSLRKENDSLSQHLEHSSGNLLAEQLADLQRLRLEVGVLRETASQLSVSNLSSVSTSPASHDGTPGMAPAGDAPPRPEPEFTYSPEYGMPLRKSISPKLSYAYEMAGRQNNLDEVKKILDENPDFVREPVGSTGATLLHTAAFNARKDIVEELLRRNANVNVQSLVGHTPLYNAVDRGTKDIVTLLLQHGANVSLPAGNGVTPLQRALEMGRTEVAEILRAAGAQE